MVVRNNSFPVISLDMMLLFFLSQFRSFFAYQQAYPKNDNWNAIIPNWHGFKIGITLDSVVHQMKYSKETSIKRNVCQRSR